MDKLKKIMEVYSMYDRDDISDKDAISRILNIIDENDMVSEFEKLSLKYNKGDIDSGEQLMSIMNIIENKYPELWSVNR